ncbi:MAG: phosphatidate cytidylyltransferase [Candidatus Eisenbacteria bacterium]|nr:phosphatidate cytidylyltransferase [Candidatus Eisenbacteria bacterium]MBU1950066.1 phosphatidate cytidylyltransferase [Candidatus Eisenbacteria bacterium]
MTGRDLWGVVISLAAISAIVALSEILRRMGASRDLTRKSVHIGIGSWCVPTLYLFDHVGAAILLPGLFVLANIAIHISGRFPSLQDEDRSNLGTIWFPLTFTLLLWIFWNPAHRGAAVAGLLTMAWGDAAASIVGRRWGRHRYPIWGGQKSWEGSLALIIATLPALMVAGRVQEGEGLPALLLLPVAVAAAILEAPCTRGLDNLILPGGIAVLFYFLT